MTWHYNGKAIEEEDLVGFVGFVYKITNLDNSRYYLGKKNLYRIKRFQKNKKRKKKTVDSDWTTYTGSNEELNEHITSGAKIHREIIHLCKSKAQMSYLEAKEQFINNVLEDPLSYNKWIMVRVRKANIIKGS